MAPQSPLEKSVAQGRPRVLTQVGQFGALVDPAARTCQDLTPHKKCYTRAREYQIRTGVAAGRDLSRLRGLS